MYEDEFILNAARLNLSDEHIVILKKLFKKGIDWTKLEQKACIHGVDTFIYYSLKKYKLTNLIPVETCKRFQENFYRNAIRNSMLLEEIDKLAEIINDKVVLLKGADLMQSLYPNIAIRKMSDIDILVEKEHINSNYKQLESIGIFKSEKKTTKSSAHSKLSKYPEHLPGLYNNKCRIEIHWNIFRDVNHYYLTKIGIETAVPFNPKCNIFHLSTEYLLTHLCSHLHAHANRIIPLRMICDINELVSSIEIKWDIINQICKDEIIKEKVSFALTFSNIFFKTQIPEPYINVKIIKEVPENLDVLLLPVIHQETHTLPKKANCFSNNFKSLNCFSDKLTFVFRTFVPVKVWLVDKYDINTNGQLIKAYINYWLYLINAHVLKKRS